MKPTLGQVPSERVPDGFANFSFIGPMARCVGDAALLLSVMAGSDAGDPFSIAAGNVAMPQARAVEAAARGLRIGWIEHFGRYRTDRGGGRADARRGGVAGQRRGDG